MALTAVGRMHVSLKQPADAAAAFDAAIAIVEDLRVLNAGGEESNSRFFANRQAPYEARIALALAAGQTAEAFHYAERSKARVLLDVIRGDRLPITKAMTEAERRQEVELRTFLTSANSELLFAARTLPRDEARIAALQRKRDQRRSAYERVPGAALRCASGIADRSRRRSRGAGRRRPAVAAGRDGHRRIRGRLLPNVGLRHYRDGPSLVHVTVRLARDWPAGRSVPRSIGES